MESRDENGHNEQRPGREFLCHTIEIGCTLEKLYCSREKGTRQKRKDNRNKGWFVEPQRKKQESTPLPLINNSIGSGMTKTAIKGGVSSSAGIPRDSGAHTSVTSDVMVWANTWEMISRTLEAFATRNTESSNSKEGKSKKPSRSRRNSKMTRTVA